MTNYENIKNMTPEELAKFLTEFSACKVCGYFNIDTNRCALDNVFICVKEYAELLIRNWLKETIDNSKQ